MPNFRDTCRRPSSVGRAVAVARRDRAWDHRCRGSARRVRSAGRCCRRPSVAVPQRIACAVDSGEPGRVGRPRGEYADARRSGTRRLRRARSACRRCPPAVAATNARRPGEEPAPRCVRGEPLERVDTQRLHRPSLGAAPLGGGGEDALELGEVVEGSFASTVPSRSSAIAYGLPGISSARHVGLRSPRTPRPRARSRSRRRDRRLEPRRTWQPSEVKTASTSSDAALEAVDQIGARADRRPSSGISSAAAGRAAAAASTSRKREHRDREPGAGDAARPRDRDRATRRSSTRPRGAAEARRTRTRAPGCERPRPPDRRAGASDARTAALHRGEHRRRRPPSARPRDAARSIPAATPPRASAGRDQRRPRRPPPAGAANPEGAERGTRRSRTSELRHARRDKHRGEDDSPPTSTIAAT